MSDKEKALLDKIKEVRSKELEEVSSGTFTASDTFAFVGEVLVQYH